MISYLLVVVPFLWGTSVAILVQQAFTNNQGGDGVRTFAYVLFVAGAIAVFFAVRSQAKHEDEVEKHNKKRHQELLDEIKKITIPSN